MSDVPRDDDANQDGSYVGWTSFWLHYRSPKFGLESLPVYVNRMALRDAASESETISVSGLPVLPSSRRQP